MFKKFEKNDVIYNTIISHPEFSFYIHRNNVYLNNEFSETGSFSNLVNHVPQGHISLHEININRPADQLIYPFITKDGARIAFKTVTTSQFDDSSQFRYGDVMSGSYPLSASISRIYSPSGNAYKTFNDDGSVNFEPSKSKKYILALKSHFDQRPINSRTHKFKYENFETTEANLICIPSIFYGSNVKRGSMEMNYYVSGTLMATLKDEKENGEMIQTFGEGSGSCAGVIFYDLGVVALTGSWDLTDAHQEKYLSSVSKQAPKWTNFGAGIPTVGHTISPTSVTGSSCLVNFKGTNKIPTMLLYAHSEEGEHNLSHNPTFVDTSHTSSYILRSGSFTEIPSKAKNIKKSHFKGHEEEYEKITYISKIGIYDQNKNLIAVATLANPVKKRESRDFTFKIRMDF